MNQIYFQIVKEIEELSHTIEQIRMEIETCLKMGNEENCGNSRKNYRALQEKLWYNSEK